MVLCFDRGRSEFRQAETRLVPDLAKAPFEWGVHRRRRDGRKLIGRSCGTDGLAESDVSDRFFNIKVKITKNALGFLASGSAFLCKFTVMLVNREKRLTFYSVYDKMYNA